MNTCMYMDRTPPYTLSPLLTPLPPPPPPLSLPLSVNSVPELRTLLSAALERVNLDLTFKVDSSAEGVVNGCHDNTSSYLLLWLLLIEIMSHCGPEVSGVCV